MQREPRVVARRRHQVGLGLQIGDAEPRKPGLLGPEQITRAAQPEILFGDAEAVLGFPQDREARPRGLAERTGVKQEAGGRAASASDPAAKLVKLGESEALGALDAIGRASCRERVSFTV